MAVGYKKILPHSVLWAFMPSYRESCIADLLASGTDRFIWWGLCEKFSLAFPLCFSYVYFESVISILVFAAGYSLCLNNLMAVKQ